MVTKDFESSLKPANKAEKIEKFKSRSRHQYLLEKEQIIHEIGDLEQIRLRLGLSQRRACQLLLVDPSAWTRWNKTGAPPHIYQALKWLLELKKISPDSIAPRDMSSRMDFMQASTQSKIKEIEDNVAALERVLTVTPSQPSQTQTYVIDNSHFEQALITQAKRFEKEILDLKLKIKQILTKKTKRASKKRTSIKRVNKKRARLVRSKYSHQVKKYSKTKSRPKKKLKYRKNKRRAMS